MKWLSYKDFQRCLLVIEFETAKSENASHETSEKEKKKGMFEFFRKKEKERLEQQQKHQEVLRLGKY